ncbi:MAG TPA: TolC family protein, partial [Gemmataceae bacterium]|nr:TolC family protein [Gemmataceae bacterium]
TQQRFTFTWQWAAIENAVRQWAGVNSLVGQQNNWNLGSSASVSKMFSTGALLTMSFANNTVFNFLSGANGLTSTSTINVNMVQPLLQGGGKAVTLEPLTQAERNLFYEIRAYARFREQFYSYIMLGTSPPASLPAAAGTTNGGSGPISVLAALGIASTDVAGQFVAYYPTLYREVDMAVDRKYVQDLEKALLLYEGLLEGGQVSPLQVDQVRSTLLGGRNAVLSDNQFVVNALDQLKLQLGIPVNAPLILDDGPVRPITRQFDRYYEVMAQSDSAYKLAEQQELVPVEKLRPFLLGLYTENPLVRKTEFRKKLPVSWNAWTKATDAELKARLDSLGQERRKLLDAKTEQEMKGKTLSPQEQSILREGEFESDLGFLEQILRRYETRPWEKLAKEELRRQDHTKLFRLVAYAAETMLVWARNERFTHVGEVWPPLAPTPLEDIDLLTADVDAAQERAVRAALTNRLDLMNARAQVVDSWRQLAVTANALLGVLNVQYHLDSTTPPGGTNPLAFSSAATNQQLIINGQLPLVRLTERNAYRTAQINYERARRNFMNLEDNIASQVRFDIRQLHLFAENYKIQKKIVESLYSQVENSLEVIVAPVDPDSLKASGTQGQVNAATLTSQYLSALGQLNNAQTKMYDIWLSYLATRMQIYVDLERLSLDLRGVWTDESGNTPVVPPTPSGGEALEGTAQPRGPGAPWLPASFGGDTDGGAAIGQPVPGNERGPALLPPFSGARLLPPGTITIVE